MPTTPFRYYFEFRQTPTGNAVIEAVYDRVKRLARLYQLQKQKNEAYILPD